MEDEEGEKGDEGLRRRMISSRKDDDEEKE